MSLLGPVLRVCRLSFWPTENVDYIGETAEITYFPTIVAVIVCENVTITDDQLEEEAEQFGLTLTSDDPAVTFLVSFGDVIIADNDSE